MDAIKLSVTIELPGRTFMTKEACDKDPEHNYEWNTLKNTVRWYDKKENKLVEKIKYKKVIVSRKTVPAYQSINMGEDAYRYMISDVFPEWYSKGAKGWAPLSKNERLNIHLDRICKSLNGIGYSFTVFDD